MSLCVFSPDRGEVQEHHSERWEPGSEEEDQWAHTGNVTLGPLVLYGPPTRGSQNSQCCPLAFPAGQPAAEAGPAEVPDQSGLSAQWDGLTEDGAHGPEHQHRTVKISDQLRIYTFRKCSRTETTSSTFVSNIFIVTTVNTAQIHLRTKEVRKTAVCCQNSN